jgi:hypothetical protein
MSWLVFANYMGDESAILSATDNPPERIRLGEDVGDENLKGLNATEPSHRPELYHPGGGEYGSALVKIAR